MRRDRRIPHVCPSERYPAQRLRARGLRPTPAAMPEPLLSSRSRGWNGIVVELHRFRDVDVVVEVREHIVGRARRRLGESAAAAQWPHV